MTAPLGGREACGARQMDRGGGGMSVEGAVSMVISQFSLDTMAVMHMHIVSVHFVSLDKNQDAPLTVEPGLQYHITAAVCLLGLFF